MAGRNTRWTWRTWSSARWSTRQTIRWSAGVLIRWSGDQVISKGSGDQVLSRTYAYWSGDQQNVWSGDHWCILISWSAGVQVKSKCTDQLINWAGGELIPTKVAVDVWLLSYSVLSYHVFLLNNSQTIFCTTVVYNTFLRIFPCALKFFTFTYVN